MSASVFTWSHLPCVFLLSVSGIRHSLDFRAYLDNPGCSHLEIPIITSAKTLLPNQITFTCSWGYDVNISLGGGVAPFNPLQRSMWTRDFKGKKCPEPDFYMSSFPKLICVRSLLPFFCQALCCAGFPFPYSVSHSCYLYFTEARHTSPHVDCYVLLPQGHQIRDG